MMGAGGMRSRSDRCLGTGSDGEAYRWAHLPRPDGGEAEPGRIHAVADRVATAVADRGCFGGGGSNIPPGGGVLSRVPA